MVDVIEKLEQLAQYVEATKDESIVHNLDIALDGMMFMDFFGTEGQNDPRGDQREAEFIPDEPDDDDSDGEYNYFRVETVENAVKCIRKFISMLKAEDNVYMNECADNSFQYIFNEYGLN